MNTWVPALLSSGVVTALVPALIVVMNRRQNKALSEKTLAEAQQTAQETALDSAEKAYATVKRQCDACFNELDKVRVAQDKIRAACDALIDAVVEVVPLLPADAESTLTLRAAIRSARQARYDYRN